MLTLKTINREVAKPLGVNLVKTDDGFALIGTVVDCLQDKDIQVESLNDKPYSFWKEKIEAMVLLAKSQEKPKELEQEMIVTYEKIY